LRLLFVLDTLAAGGAQRQMVNLAVGLHQQGHEIRFFRYLPGNTLLPFLEASDIPVSTYFRRSRYDLRVFIELRKIIRSGQFDLVLSYLPHSNFYSIISARLAMSRSHVVISERSTDVHKKQNWRVYLFRQFYRLADHVVTNSHHQRIYISRKHPWLSGKISTIYNGLDLDTFHPPLSEPDESPLKLLAIGSVHRTKNAECLVEALAILRDNYALCPQLNWAGRHFNSYSQEIDQKIKQHSLETQWAWLGERIDIVSMLHDHHALVHPSYVEGLPNVVCEALACARPVIISDVLDHPRLVQDGKNGFLFTWDNPQSLAERIRDFFALPAERRYEMGRDARKFAEENLSLDRLAVDYEALFRSLVKQPEL